MSFSFERQVRDATQQVYTAVGDLSAEVERRNQYSGVLVAELDTQMQELLAATRTLAASCRNCVFDLGVAGVANNKNSGTTDSTAKLPNEQN
ncbi:hypothetical protein LPJ57_007590 [Coemansia sp. RSA 486]|nr:hypothetical protein LPJ57_007590 [Coemansia sp. RSA 486]KAJ2231965.1 hypothetical protein IWW45_005323 [Coemansia sp. RSA 485]KAJ2597849.1 hypothetical protein GGF39_002880 [Coemansia sp. RSA 1721]